MEHVVISNDHPHEWTNEDNSWPEWEIINENLTIGYDTDDIILIGSETSQDSEIHFSITESTDFFITWMQNNPCSEIIIIITEQPACDWAQKLKTALLHTPETKYVLIVDWSMYIYPSYRFQAAYGVLVADTLSRWITMASIDLSRVEIIGFSISAHVAGLIGNYQRPLGQIVARIVALEPASFGGWSNPRQHRKLLATSAQMVQVIHTNTRRFGYHYPLGMYDIYVNGGSFQPSCGGQGVDVDQCSHQLAIRYYIESIDIYTEAVEGRITTSGIAIKSGSQTIGFGYWLPMEPAVTAKIYVLETYLVDNPETKSLLIHNLMPSIGADNDGVHLPPFVVPPEIPKLTPNIFFHIYSMQEGVEHLLTSSIPLRIPHINGLVHIFSGCGATQRTVLIINGEQDNDFNWVTQLKDAILSAESETIVIVVDWTPYKLSSYKATTKFVVPMANTIIKSLQIAKAPANLQHIVGYSMGAHIASFAGKLAQQMLYGQIYRITGLDPSSPMFNYPHSPNTVRLASSDASFVDVIHTNAIYYGFPSPIGSVDFYVNGGKLQPGCPEIVYDDTDCSHKRATYLFIESVSVQSYALKVSYEENLKLVFLELTEFTVFGYHIQPNTQGVFYINTKDQSPYLKVSTTRRLPQGVSHNGLVKVTDKELGPGLIPGFDGKFLDGRIANSPNGPNLAVGQSRSGYVPDYGLPSRWDAWADQYPEADTYDYQESYG